MKLPTLRSLSAALFAACIIPITATLPAQTSPGATATPSAAVQPSAQSAADARARRRAARKRAGAAQQQPSQQPRSGTSTVAPTAAQRRRDAELLATQKAQSAESAKENDALTRKVVADQQRQQAEPRIQEAPGPDSQPLPGAPAVAPSQAAEPPRIQDAPGPAQTLPQAPPQTPAPTPAPQT